MNWKQKNGAYTQEAIGYLSATGDMDFAIAIRTMILKIKQPMCRLGQGLSMTLSPKNEYQETINKAKSMTRIGELRP